MNSTILRRLSAAVIAPALAAGMIVAAPSAQAAPASANSDSAARWLAGQLSDGIVVTGGKKRYGQTLDIFFALDGLGVGEAAASSIIEAFKAQQNGYTTGGADDPGSRYVGATSKLATAVRAAGQDPTSFGGQNLVGYVDGFVTADGPQKGRASDVSTKYGDNSNTLGQSYAVQVLAAAGNPKAKDATDYLLKQQCANGGFRTFEFTEAVPDPMYPIPAIDLVCGEGPTADDDELSVDTTSLALQTLLTAKSAGVTGLDDDIADAASWLKSVQAADGSFQDRGTANASSTGYAAAALAAVGENVAADSAASWLEGRQVTDTFAQGTPLAAELGAIAPDQETLVQGRTEGITAAERIRWVIATAQGALGLDARLPATFAVSAPGGYLQGGKPATVVVAGLSKGEKFSVQIAGGANVAGRADTSGRGTVVIALPTATGVKTVTATGARGTRTGATSVSVLGARKFPTKVKSSVKKNKRQTLRVSGLAAGEKVTVRYRGKTIRTAKATSKGTYSYSFKVGVSKGKKTVWVKGAFANRSSSKSFKVK
jgi:hypothetical protein